MIGKRLYNLLQELDASQSKRLLHLCSVMSDKRYGVLKKLINSKDKSQEVLNSIIRKEALLLWGNSKEIDLKERRLVDFFSGEIENTVIESFLEKKSGFRHLLLSEAFQKSGNPELLDYYHEKVYKIGNDENEWMFRLLSLKGKLRLKYASVSEKRHSEALLLNEELYEVITKTYEEKTIEYYNNLSNLYIENSGILGSRKNKLIIEIEKKMAITPSETEKLSMLVSLIRLIDDRNKAAKLIEEGKQIIIKHPSKDKGQFIIEKRKFLFMQLITGFYNGKHWDELVEICNEVLTINKMYNFVDNSTMFYKMLLLVISGYEEKVLKEIKKEKFYFKGEGLVFKNFIFAVIAEKEKNFTKALKLLQPLLYVENYYLALWSRILEIRIHFFKGNEILCESLIVSTRKLILKNKNKLFGKEGANYLLNFYQHKINNRSFLSKKENLSTFYLFLTRD